MQPTPYIYNRAIPKVQQSSIRGRGAGVGGERERGGGRLLNIAINITEERILKHIAPRYVRRNEI